MERYKHPTGSGKINIKIFDKNYNFKDNNEFKNEFKRIIEYWVKNI